MYKHLYIAAFLLMALTACHRTQPKQEDNPGDTVPASVFEPDTTNKVNPEDTVATDTSINVINEAPTTRRNHRAKTKHQTSTPAEVPAEE